MPRVVYFDCFSGISGDMALGALIDAGVSLDALRAMLQRLGVGGWELHASREVRGPLAGTRAHVVAPEDHHRTLTDIRTLISGAPLPSAVVERSIRIFTLLAEAEARVHGTTVDQVHFHEVGALDAIVDIVGVVIGLDLLGVEQVFASPIPPGAGWVRSAHGPIPVPAPATLALLASVGAPVTADETPFELTTPTGAAILAALATFRRPPMRLRAVGYGFGARRAGWNARMRCASGSATWMMRQMLIRIARIERQQNTPVQANRRRCCWRRTSTTSQRNRSHMSQSGYAKRGRSMSGARRS